MELFLLSLHNLGRNSANMFAGPFVAEPAHVNTSVRVSKEEVIGETFLVDEKEVKSLDTNFFTSLRVDGLWFASRRWVNSGSMPI